MKKEGIDLKSNIHTPGEGLYLFFFFSKFRCWEICWELSIKSLLLYSRVLLRHYQSISLCSYTWRKLKCVDTTVEYNELICINAWIFVEIDSGRDSVVWVLLSWRRFMWWHIFIELSCRNTRTEKWNTGAGLWTESLVHQWQKCHRTGWKSSWNIS